MALITRVSRLFRADMHAVLDRIEEPDLLLKQAIREMEAAYSEDEQRSRLLKHELGQLESRQQSCNKKLDTLAVELDICFHSGKEELARELIRRQLE
ncbi:MAG: PspA/IM30 family protein, partial [Sedimenticola sp.]|nr:PspA/IM30 family protein [Sedimenticola sp.]